MRALERARARLAEPEFVAAAARLRAELREDLVRPVLVPPPDRPAGYYHDYFCPQHGVQLEFDWQSPRAHRCPVDGARFRGEPYDRSWWWFVNHAHSEAAFRLALGWRLAGERACLDRLREVLAAYAAHYPEAGWPKDDPRPRQGKVTFHALDEAVWLIPLAWAYDLTKADLGAAARGDVEARLLQPAAEHLLAQRWPQVHNYMCWLNAGIAAAATIVGRTDLLTAAIDEPYGFRQQVAEGVLDDGTWWEGSASYHFYTLAALLALIRSLDRPDGRGGEAARLADTLRQHPKVRRMFLAPLRWAYPDLSLPAINDCWYHSSLVGECGHGIPPAAAFYELAAGWYGDPAFDAILAANYERGQARDSAEALLFGPDAVRHGIPGEIGSLDERQAPRPTPRVLTASADLPEFGIAVLRGPSSRAGSGRSVAAEADDRTFLLLKYGRHGGGHGHPDKLGIVVAGGGERLSPDLGTPGYGIALNDTWYRHTLSHNTVLIDGQPQPPATGRLLAFSPPRRSNGRAGAGGGAAGAGAGPAFGLVDAAVEWPADAHDVTLGSRPDARRPNQTPLGAYDGVKLRRLILFRPRYFVDVFAVSCPEEREIEWVYHNLGRLTQLGPPTSSGAQGASEGESPTEPSAVDGASTPGPPTSATGAASPALPEPLRLCQALSGGQDLLATFATGGAGLRLWLQAIGPGTVPKPAIATAEAPEVAGDVPLSWVLAAEGPANPASETMALILRRCRAPRALFAAVFHPHRGGRPSVRAVSWSQEGDVLSCEVQLRGSTDRWEIPLQADSRSTSPRLQRRTRAGKTLS